MAQIYDSSHSGQEIDAAVDAVQTTIPSQLAQIGLKIGDLSELETTDKNNVVAAVNEINGKVSSIASGKYYGYYGSASALPTSGNENGYAYVGATAPYSIYNGVSNGGTMSWTDSGSKISSASVADEEDITQDSNGKLSLKDRGTTDGMGYIILRKNKTFASQVTKANTIYEIRYDFDLDDASVTIPSGCVLKFNGGKLSNGTITGNRTKVAAPLFEIFGNALALDGTWNINECYAEWFGAVANDISLDCSTAINKALSIQSSSDQYIACRLLVGKYYTKSSILLDRHKTLYGTGINGTYIIPNSEGSYPAIEITGGANSLSNISVINNVNENDALIGVGIAVGKSDLSKSATKGEIRNVGVQRFDVGIALYYQWCNAFDSISVSHNNVGISVADTETVLYKCNIEQNYDYGLVSTGLGVHIIGCVIEGNKYGCSLEGSVNDIIDCYFESNSESYLNPSAEKDGRGVDIHGGHIIAGMDNTLKHLAIVNCHFANGTKHNNDIYVDKCNSLNIICPPEEIIHLKTTDNTFINSLPAYTGQVAYNPSSSQKKSALPFFSITDFSILEAQDNSNNTFILLNINYLRMNSSRAYIKVQDGFIYSYRTSENATEVRRIDCYIGRDIYANFKNPICVIEYEINNPDAKIDLTISINQNGTSSRIVGFWPVTYLTPGRRNRAIINFKKLGVDNLAESSRIEFRLALTNDTFVSEEEDMGSKSFIMTGLYFYDGDNFDYNGNNTFNEFSRHTSDRYIARTGSVYSPQASRPTIPEKGMVIYDDPLNKLILYNGTAWVNMDGSALS